MSTRSADQARRSEVASLIPALRALAHAFCLRPEQADDLVQVTLDRALARIDHLEGDIKLRSWLFAIMRNAFQSQHERRAPDEVAMPPRVGQHAVSEAQHSGALMADEVMHALNRLPQHHREILVLIVMLGERYEDAAVICDCRIGTVKSRLNRARRQLTIELGEAADEAGRSD